MKVVAYLRVSSKFQVDKNGFARQLEEIRNFCKIEGHKIVQVFREDITGKTSYDERPEFQKVLEYCKANRVDHVVVEGIDRIARKTRAAFEFVEDLFDEEGLSFLSARTGENLTEEVLSDPYKRAMVQMQCVFTELEHGLIVKRLQDGRKREAQKHGGKFRGGQKSYAEIVPEAKAFAEGYQQAGHTLKEVAAELNRLAFRTPRGGEWTARTVCALLRAA